jgi:hypothetical protein
VPVIYTGSYQSNRICQTLLFYSYLSGSVADLAIHTIALHFFFFVVLPFVVLPFFINTKVFYTEWSTQSDSDVEAWRVWNGWALARWVRVTATWRLDGSKLRWHEGVVIGGVMSRSREDAEVRWIEVTVGQRVGNTEAWWVRSGSDLEVCSVWTPTGW